MRRIRLRLLVLVLLALAWAPDLAVAGPEQDAAAIRLCPALVYSANPHYPPYHWSSDGRAIDGASIELLKLALPPGVALKPVVYPWKRTMQLAAEGEIDLLVSLRITPEREKYLTFAKHRAFPNPIVVFVRKDKAFPFKSWEDLKARHGGISLGDTFGGGFDEYLRQELSVDEAPTMESNFKKLEAGRIDYFVTSKFVGAAYSATHLAAQRIVSLSPAISEQDIHFGFSRLSPCAALAEQVSERLRELDRRGIPEQLLRKHLRRFENRSVMLPD